MDHPGDSAAAIIAADPVGQAGRVLRRLLARVGGTGAAVLCSEDAHLRVLIATNLALTHSQRIQGLWQTHRFALAAGGHHIEDDIDLAPILENSCLIGALYIEGARKDRGSIREYLRILAKAITAATSPVRVGYDCPGSMDANPKAHGARSQVWNGPRREIVGVFRVLAVATGFGWLRIGDAALPNRAQ